MAGTRSAHETLLGPDVTLDDIVTHTRHIDAGVRRTALLVLSERVGSGHGPDAGEGDADPEAEVLRSVILEGLSDRSPLVRREAAEQAGRHPGLAAGIFHQLGAALTTDGETLCREAAAFALGESDHPDAAGVLVACLGDERDPAVRESVAGALGALGDPATMHAVIDLTTGEKPAVRRRAVVALAAFDHPDAEAAIRRAAGDRDRFVREAADWLLRDD